MLLSLRLSLSTARRRCIQQLGTLGSYSQSHIVRTRQRSTSAKAAPRVEDPAQSAPQEDPILYLPRHDIIIPQTPDRFSLHLARSGRVYDFEPVEKVEKQGVQVEALEDVAWRPQNFALKHLPGLYANLSKIRLTNLVVLTALAGYVVAPGAFSLLDCSLMCLGTGLNACAANALNQYMEVPYDSQMNRTKNRILVRGRISPLHAVSFAAVAGTVGGLTLYYGLNPLTAALGLSNLLLYAFVYTPSKRLTISNTWIGAVVGAIPPVMGWAASTGLVEPGALLLGGILYAWQFPHFNALSWNLRPEYSRAGYLMPSVIRPDLCTRVSLRYCAALIALCSLAPPLGVTTWLFAADSLPFNLYLTYLAFRFHQNPNAKSSRKLFLFTLIHMPVLLLLMIISKDMKAESGNWQIAHLNWDVFRLSAASPGGENEDSHLKQKREKKSEQFEISNTEVPKENNRV